MFGRLIVAHRQRLALTQEALAQKSGLSTRSLRDLESGRVRAPRKSSVRLLADALGLQGQEREQFCRLAYGPTVDPGGPGRPAEGGSTNAVPAQLPADAPGFTGRDTELSRLDAVLTGGHAGPATAPVVISALSGTAGVGKTALAVHWAHRVRDRFPDGQLYLNLRGFHPGGAMTAMTGAEALRGVLDALGVSPGRVPPSLDAQVGLYRTLLAGRRILVLLDNARDADQVRPLLPGTPGCLTLITSRDRLTSLVAAEGAYPLSLDLLTPEEARQLLVRRLGQPRTAAEPAAVERIVAACARLPLALVVVAAHAAIDPQRPLHDLAGELRDAGLDLLTAGDAATDVRAVFSWSYRGLSPDAARLFRLLGFHPGPDVSAPAAASLAAMPIDQARQALTELTHVHMLTERTPGRYLLHDLLQAYATELATKVDRGRERKTALRRMFDHYLHSARPAAELLNPHRPRIRPARPARGVVAEAPASDGEAQRWFAVEHPVLLTAIERAARYGFDTHAWQLTHSVTTFLNRQGRWHDLMAAQTLAVAAAKRAADRFGELHALRDLAFAHIRLGHHDLAHTQYLTALDICVELGDRTTEATIHFDIVDSFDVQGRHLEALSHVERGYECARGSGRPDLEGTALNMFGWCHAQLGEHDKALAYCEQALPLCEQAGHVWSVAGIWDSLGYIHHRLGNHRKAIRCYQRSLQVIRRTGDRYREAQTLAHLGDSHLAAANRTAARGAWTQALAIQRELDQPDAGELDVKRRSLRPH